MLFVIDIGNSNIVLGLYREEQIAAHWRIATKKQKTADEYGILVKDLFRSEGFSPEDVDGIIISCVVPPLLPIVEEMSQRYFQITPLVVGPGIKTGMPILYDNPKEVGADRIVNAVAAYTKYRRALIVVDFGTATTFDHISERGEYLGGIISPGIMISIEALFYHASKLPRIEVAKPRQIIGKTTINAMQSGIYYGYIGLVDGIVNRIKSEVGSKIKVIATGGLADLIAAESTTIETVEPSLTLEGLRLIHQMNQKTG